MQTPKSPKKSKSRFTIIEFPVFSNYWIHAEFASDIAAATKKYPSTECVGEEALDTYEALTIHVEENCSFIFLKPNASAGTIAHESYHAIKRMFDVMDVKKQNEVVAYHLGYLVDQITKFRSQRCKVPKPRRVSKQKSKSGRE